MPSLPYLGLKVASRGQHSLCMLTDCEIIQPAAYPLILSGGVTSDHVLLDPRANPFRTCG